VQFFLDHPVFFLNSIIKWNQANLQDSVPTLLLTKKSRTFQHACEPHQKLTSCGIGQERMSTNCEEARDIYMFLYAVCLCNTHRTLYNGLAVICNLTGGATPNLPCPSLSLIPGQGGGSLPQSIPGSPRGVVGLCWTVLPARCPFWPAHELNNGGPGALVPCPLGWRTPI